MLDIFTVVFFGHRYIYDPYTVEKLIEEKVKKLISQKTYVDFIVGRNGDFDRCVASAVNRVRKNYRDDNSSLVLFLPYETAEYKNNASSFEKFYSNIEILNTREITHPKAAMKIRNRQMVDRADLIICYIEQQYGGAFEAVKYALKQSKKIINLAVEENI